MTVCALAVVGPITVSRMRSNAPRVVHAARFERPVVARRKKRSHRTSATEHDALMELALRDDYDPYAVLFCLNALFLSTVLNVLNFGLERDGEGKVSIPKGGIPVILRRSSKGIFDYFTLPMKQIFMSEELKLAVEDLKAAKREAYMKRGTPGAEEAALKFISARKTAIDLGLPEDSSLLGAQTPADLD